MENFSEDFDASDFDNYGEYKEWREEVKERFFDWLSDTYEEFKNARNN
ncbi:MAG: hypothetical protein FWE37_02530 [Spirochaetaceae bacterium]|nr:hypothetical protein [Spirochaetaceae bacterium]